MKKYTTKLFNLKGIIVDKVDVDESVYIHVRSPRRWARCPLCGKAREQQDSSKKSKER